MMDHDQRFKTLIKEFFYEFLLLFFRPWAERFDCSVVEWLDKEVFPDPPKGDRRVLDLVAKLPTREVVPGQKTGEPDHWLALIHLEIESPEKATPLRPRIYHSYGHLRATHGLPVLPIGLFLKVGLEGIGIDVYEEYFWELRPIRFEYLYVGLPALDAVEYLNGDNWLGVALSALMKIPKDKAAWLGAEALRKIKDAPLNDQKRFLLGECVQAYLPLNEEQQQEFQKLVATERYEGVHTMNTTWYERGIMEGEEKGEKKADKAVFDNGQRDGQCKFIRRLLENRFGPLSPSFLERLQQIPLERLETIFDECITASSLVDLRLED